MDTKNLQTFIQVAELRSFTKAAEKLGYTVTEMPVVIINHREARSKVSPVKDTIRMLRDIRKIKKRTKNIR